MKRLLQLPSSKSLPPGSGFRPFGPGSLPPGSGSYLRSRVPVPESGTFLRLPGQVIFLL
ncbi:hypothetical protein F2Q69_00052703 [Brassica cretica]|uniref:Uncharacterized protein n=1 Tax=Brassica cretica TaxID=69181 RepID=A0A8S9N9D9_BRACR|nr:hypothetical protein F2Q69_00052703 [Brassica cretica]